MKYYYALALLAVGPAVWGCSSAPQQTSNQMSSQTAMRVSVTGGIASWVAGETRWSVPVSVSFENRGSKMFELDKATGCEAGDVSNDVFEVLVDGKAVPYKGIMRKRAHPGTDGFWKIRAGERHVVEVDLGPHYGFHEKGGTALIRFRHFNHFSKDAVQLESEQTTMQLQR